MYIQVKLWLEKKAAKEVSGRIELNTQIFFS